METFKVDLMMNALMFTYQNGLDLFNALYLVKGDQLVKEQKFHVVDGELNYYIYNCKCIPFEKKKILSYWSSTHFASMWSRVTLLPSQTKVIKKVCMEHGTALVASNSDNYWLYRRRNIFRFTKGPICWLKFIWMFLFRVRVPHRLIYNWFSGSYLSCLEISDDMGLKKQIYKLWRDEWNLWTPLETATWDSHGSSIPGKIWLTDFYNRTWKHVRTIP